VSAVIDTTVVGAQALGYSSDERLISRLRAHDDDAFAQLVARYERQLLSFCRRMLGSREDAEDVLQDTFAAAYKAILADERVIECRPWLYQIARNRCLNAIRGRRPTQSLSLDGIEPEVTLGTVEQVAHRLEIKLLVNDILALPDQQRQALVLHELEGCSYEQIAHTMGTSVASVRSLLLRARRTLLALAEGRALPCAEARAQLDEPAGPTAAARRHLELCSDCAGHRQQRKRRSARALRAISPLGLVFALRQAVLRRGVQAAAGSSGAAGAGSAATAGAGGAATAGAGFSAVAAKALAGLAVLAAAGTGTVVVQQVTTGAQRHARPPAAVNAPAVVPAQTAPAVTSPAPPVSPPSVHRSPAPKPATTTTPSSTPTPSAGQPTQPGTPSNQGSQGTTGVQTPTTPAAAGRTRPVPGAGMSPTRTRPVPFQPQYSGRTWPQGSSTGSSSGTGSTPSSSGQGSSTGDSGQGSSTTGTDSGQSASGGRSSLSSPTGPGSSNPSDSTATQGTATS
jgi:RNA polymerase sigma factor (sigma-70 family)